MCESFRILCALCRVGLYALYRRLCCKGPSPVRPNFAILCIGLEGAGKSSILATLSGDDLHKIEPTIGFSIKAILFEDCILDVKELGGGDKVRPYWERYFQTFQGIIFVIDSSSEEGKLQTAKTELHNAVKHQQLKSLPLLVILTGQDKENARSVEEVSQFLEADTTFSGRQWLIRGCVVSNKETLLEIFSHFNEILQKNLDAEIEQRQNSPQHTNRL
ncbi:ADP-ribosylation factor-like protein 15 [Aplysia californica]|uniref:ADP-ribosylation factor-like protein 15 n=1 Tax=Aplysia californica TaxID=6500 RepID=A0ABM0JH10_APLCA|nr:ADP-ribosylation factor-like protein 15 [Aplysia californica]